MSLGFPRMRPAWQPQRDRLRLVWGASTLLVVSMLCTVVTGLLISNAFWWASIEPLEGMVVVAPLMMGAVTTALALGAAVVAGMWMRADGVPRLARTIARAC